MDSAADPDALDDFAELDEWGFEETLVHARRQGTDSVAHGVTAGDVPELSPGERADVPVCDAESSRASSHPAAPIPPPARADSTWAWCVVACGLAVATCGAALMAMGLLKPSAPLWQLGLPMLLAGQFAILSIVVWHLDVVWHSHRATFVALHAVDEQVRQLQPRVVPPRAITRYDAPTARASIDPPSPHMILAQLRTELAALSRCHERTQDAA